MANRVTVYTTPSCTYCRQLKRFLAERGIQYKEVDVSTDEAAARDLVYRTRQYGVPVTEIGGTLVVGFDRPRLERLLQVA